MLLSIIIPIYNSEKFLNDCIDSIYLQKLFEKDFELILIDDGSTDNSFQICEKYQKKHSNILIFQKENGGQSTARNLGLRKAHGKYVMFVDSDDKLSPYTIHKLVEGAEGTKSEITISSMIVYNATGEIKRYNDFPYYGKTISGKLAILSGLNFGSSCARLYRRDFLLHNNIEFKPGIKHEDVLFSVRCAVAALRLTSMEICTYEYRWVEGSTDRSTDFSQKVKAIFSDLEIAGEEKKLSLDKELDKDMRININKRCNSLVISNLIQLTKNDRRFRNVLSRYIIEAKGKGILPFKGSALSWRSTLMCKLFNLVMKVMRPTAHQIVLL